VRTKEATADAHLARGIAAAAAGERDRAIECYRAALGADPGCVDARRLLGALLAERGDVEEAVEVLEAAAALAGPLQADTTAVYNNLANALRLADRRDEAERLLRDLTRVAPREWHAWHNLGQLLKDTDCLHEAVACLRRAVALAPDHGPNHGVLGEVLHKLGRLRSADAALRRCVALGWDTDVNLWTVLGNNHRHLGELAEAQVALERAYELSGGQGSAVNNLAIIAAQRGRFDEAITLYERALEAEPENASWRANLGYAQLTAGRLPEGWHNWEAGLYPGGPRGAERDLGVPRWTPEHTGGRVLCAREQGVGDEILFASCLPDLAATAGEVVYEANSRLVSLFARSFPEIEVRPVTLHPAAGETMRDCDASIPVGSLPLHFRTTVDRFPSGRRSYLVADPERVARWQERLAPLGDGPRVAISWRSRIKTAERRLEYTNLLADWAPIFAIPGVVWLNVQYDDCERELLAAEERFGVTVHRWDDVDYMNDFEAVAALMVACDLVIAPRNAVAMLAGALGVPTVAMGNRWDWSDLGTDSLPWFPSLELVFRHFGEEWDAVVATTASRVARLASEKGTS
jgi:tetratricopeptide (TPR) repeat protein